MQMAIMKLGNQNVIKEFVYAVIKHHFANDGFNHTWDRLLYDLKPLRSG